ncbi:MAG: uracil-DNA glycosylase family protein [Polyangiales bacterium]
MNASRRLALLQAHQAALRACQQCPDMHRPSIVGQPVLSPVLLVGQAPGDKEPKLGRPFAWTAGRQLFKWFASVGLPEVAFRERVYMAAVCRCFPGKRPKGGDRVPTPHEIATCRPWLQREIALLEPGLIIPVGQLAISQFLTPRPLLEQIGQRQQIHVGRLTIDVIPLPHPSGASPWPRIEPGKGLTARALALIAAHPAWQQVLEAG